MRTRGRRVYAGYRVGPPAARVASSAFPGYTLAQLAAVLRTLAGEAGLSLTREAECRAAALLAQAEADYSPANAHLAVRLLNQIVVAQARRAAASSGAQYPATLSTVIARRSRAPAPRPRPAVRIEPRFVSLPVW